MMGYLFLNRINFQTLIKQQQKKENKMKNKIKSAIAVTLMCVTLIAVTSKANAYPQGTWQSSPTIGGGWSHNYSPSYNEIVRPYFR